jgi:hypothetical protein
MALVITAMLLALFIWILAAPFAQHICRREPSSGEVSYAPVPTVLAMEFAHVLSGNGWDSARYADSVRSTFLAPFVDLLSTTCGTLQAPLRTFWRLAAALRTAPFNSPLFSTRISLFRVSSSTVGAGSTACSWWLSTAIWTKPFSDPGELVCLICH